MQLKKKRAVISYDGNQVCYSTRTAITNSKPSVGSINEKRDFFFFFLGTLSCLWVRQGMKKGRKMGVDPEKKESSVNVIV